MSGIEYPIKTAHICVVCKASLKRDDPIMFYHSRYDNYFHKSCFEDFTCDVANGRKKWEDLGK